MKADPTDMTAVSDFNAMQSKVEKMDKEAEKCKDSKYGGKIMEITAKMMNSAAGL